MLAMCCAFVPARAQQAPQGSERDRVTELLRHPITPDAAAETALIQSRVRQFGLNAQLRIAAYPETIGAKARRAWYEAVAAREALPVQERGAAAGSAAAELAAKMRAVGNMPVLDELRHRLVASEGAAEVSKAQSAVVRTGQALVRIMGVTRRAEALALPNRLPALPATILPRAEIEAGGYARRVDVIAAVRNVHGTARALGLQNPLRQVDVLADELPGHDHAPLLLPSYDFSQAHAEARRLYEDAIANARDVALFARSEMIESYDVYRTAHDAAMRHERTVTPARQRISEEVLLRYNGMLGSVFDVLSDVRESAHAMAQEIALRRDFWIADTNLREAMTGPFSEVARMPYEH